MSTYQEDWDLWHAMDSEAAKKIKQLKPIKQTKKIV